MSRVLTSKECRELWQALENDDPEPFRIAVENGADLSLPSAWERFAEMTPLLVAAYCGKTRICRYLLSLDIDPNEKWSGTTPLLEMFSGGNQTTELVKLLLDAGADVNQRSGKIEGDRKVTPLMLAAHASHRAEEICRYLIEHGADAKLLSWQGWSAMTFACSVGNFVVARMLFEEGAPPAGPCLFRPVLDGNIEFVRFLIHCNADLNKKPDQTRRAQTPLESAVQAWATEQVTAKARSEMEALGYKRSQPTAQKLKAVCIELLSGGADPNTGVGPDSPLQVAIRMNDLELVEALIKAGARIPSDDAGDPSMFIRTIPKSTDQRIISRLAASRPW